MDSDHRPVGELHELDETCGAKNLALAIAAEVVLVDRHIGTVLLARLRLGEADGGHLGLAVGDAGNVDVGDDNGIEPGDLFGDEYAVLESAVRELQARRNVADGKDPGNVGAQTLIDEDPAALHSNALLLEAHAGRVGATTHGYQKQIGVKSAAIFERDAHAVGVLRGAGEPNPGDEVDAALAECALESLGAGLVLVGDKAWQAFDDRDRRSKGLPHAGELHSDDSAA